MKNRIALALLLTITTLTAETQETALTTEITVTLTDDTALESAVITIKTPTTHNNIKAVIVTPEQAEELKSTYTTTPVQELENSPLQDKVFMIENTNYFIQTEEAKTNLIETEVQETQVADEINN